MLWVLVVLLLCIGSSSEENSGTPKVCPDKAVLTIPCENACTTNTNCTEGLICCEGACKINETDFNKSCVRPDVCADYCKNGTCIVGSFGSPSCFCYEGYKGVRCDEEIKMCDSNPCLHGTCINKFNDYKCLCKDGYAGKNCEEKRFRSRMPWYQKLKNRRT